MLFGSYCFMKRLFILKVLPRFFGEAEARKKKDRSSDHMIIREKKKKAKKAKKNNPN